MHKIIKIALYTIGFVLVLVLGLVVYVDSPWGQNYIRGRAEAFLTDKLKTEVRIGHLGYGFPKYIVLNNALFLDQRRDTMLAFNTLKVDLDMWKLIRKKIEIKQIVLNGTRSHIYRNAPDTNYNYSYIITAFSGSNSQSKQLTNSKQNTSSQLSFHVDRIKLDDIHFRLDDYTGGLQLGCDLDHLDLKLKELDLDSMLFHVKDISVSGLQAVFAQDTSYLPPIPKDTTKSRIKIIADNSSLNNISFKYNNRLNKFLFALQLGALQLQLNQYNRDNNFLDIQKLSVNNSNAVLSLNEASSRPSPIDTIVKIDTTEGWTVNAKSVDLSGLNFKMDNIQAPKRAGIDYSHLNISNLGLNLRDFIYSNDTVSGNMKHFAVKEQSGLDVREFKTIFNYNDRGLLLKNLYIQTPNSTIQNYIEVHYPSLAAVKKRMQTLQMKVDIRKSYVGMQDVMVLMPELRKNVTVNSFKNNRLNIDAALDGFVDKLNITRCNINGLSNTEIILTGKINGLPDTGNLSYNLNITKIQSSRNDIEWLLPQNIKSLYRLPDWFSAMGKFWGTKKDYYSELLFASSDGIAYIKGMLAMSPGQGKEKYDIDLKTHELNLGRMMRLDSLMGPVTVNVDTKGQGLDTKTMNAVVSANIGSAFIKGYRYHDISMDGKAIKGKLEANSTSADSNLRVQLHANADFNGKYVALIADIHVDSADLRALKLSGIELRARGLIHADIKEFDPDYPNGSITWYQATVVVEGKRYFMDSLYIISRPDADTGQNIYANLDFIQAHISGHTPLTKVGPIIEDHINRHVYSLPIKDSLKGTIASKVGEKKVNKTAAGKFIESKLNPKKDTSNLPSEYNLNLIAHVSDKPIIHGMLSGISSFDSIHIDANLSPRNLTLNVNSPELVYYLYTVENWNVQIRGNDSSLSYNITADEMSKDRLAIWYASARGNLGSNFLTSNISVSDSLKKERFALAVNVHATGAAQIMEIQPGLKLNYQAWQVSQPNSIVFSDGGMYIQNLAISNQGQSISANSVQPQINTPLKINVSNFQLASITNTISKDTLLANGVLSGNFTIEKMTPLLKVTGDMQIQNLLVFGDTLGDLQGQFSNITDDQIDTKITLKGYGNDISLNGIYYLKTSSSNDFDFNLSINSLAVQRFQSIAMNQIRNSSGYLRGNLHVQGEILSPKITGELRTDKVSVTVSALNTNFKMPAEKVEFSTDKINFNNFIIQDSAGNKAQISGTVGLDDITDPDLDLKVSANNWQAVHSSSKENKDLYGNLLVTTNLNINGSVLTPLVDGDISILKGTKLTVSNPEKKSEIESTKGIVVFVNMRDTSWGKYLMPHVVMTKAKRKFSPGSDVNVNITVSKDAEFNLIIDPATGDFISVRGDGYLNAALTPAGVLNVTGNYSLHSGIYQMNYNFIRRRFLIQDGSTVTFGGDPLNNTTLDVTAFYEAKVPPYDLVMRQVPDPTQLNYFKQSLPFDVSLHMKGNLVEPAFTFDVLLPQDKVYPLAADQIELVEAKLSQLRADTSEMNKQVFAVLILGRFVSDDPFSSGTAQGISTAAVQSVSTFIGEQLNQAANKLVKGVDLSVDLATTQDYTTGDMRQRTDLNVAASKRVLNDRLKLTIGNDFEVEGPQTNNNTQSGLVPSNLAADYLLSADGRYTARVYRQNYDEGVLEGFVTETGLNFIISVNYNRFKYIFRRRPQKQTGTLATQ